MVERVLVLESETPGEMPAPFCINVCNLGTISVVSSSEKCYSYICQPVRIVVGMKGDTICERSI